MWQRAVDLNLMSVVRLIREALPHMRQAGGGKILNVSSISVKQPIKNLMLSNSIRSATVAFLKSLSIELAPENILVHNLAPGRIGTDRVKYLDMDRAKRENRTPEEVFGEEVSGIPVGRYGTPEEFGKYAAFLLSNVNSYTTGETTYVDGGTIRSPW
jgi:3-oxoacyl-[acyl-carrier protein] reductase